ncbi:MAG: response regulator [Candidatus Omnitrophota bacterium]
MSKNIRILLVDDEVDYTQLMGFWLKCKGYDIIVASDGETAIKMVQEQAPDIVFLDLKMPVMDGIETLRHIRKISKTLPVIIVTVDTAEKRFSEAGKLGTSGFFPKKGNFENLEKLIEVALRTHKDLKDKE